MNVKKPASSRQAHKHMDAMLDKAVAVLGRGFTPLQLAQWSLTASLTPCQRYEVGVFILNFG